jgi:hypothetical protein
MTPIMSMFLRCLLALALVIVLLSLTDYAVPATLSSPAIAARPGPIR